MKKIVYFLLISIFALFPFYFSRAASATLFLSPASGQYGLGQVFSVAVKVNSGGQAINAADGVLNFNPDQLEVLSLSRTGSIFNLWTSEPSFSNYSGEIKFGGGTPQNYSGSSGTILNISFKSKTIGLAKVNFSVGSVLAADFKGTNVLGSLGGGNYEIKPGTIPPEEYVPPAQTPLAPSVSSVTHPESAKWYSDNDPKFNWSLPADVTGIRLAANEKPVSLPNIVYSELISEKQLEDLNEGVWYFHIQFKNKFGWGGVTHFKFQIDTIPPEPFEIEVKEGNQTSNPQPTIFFEAKDKTSGIDYYQIKIGEGGWVNVNDKEYILPVQALGRHMIIVKALDRAGNSTLAMNEIEILPIEAPKITDYPKELISGSALLIKGTALPESTITLYIDKEGKMEKGQTKSDNQGNFTYIHDKILEKGIYNIYAETTDKRGARSGPSEKITIFITAPIFIRIGQLVIDYLTVIATLFVFLWFIIFFLLWAWRKSRKKKKKIKKELGEAEKALNLAFRTLKSETEKQIAKLDGKPGLSEREEKILKDLKEALEISEKFIEKEIKDIKKEL